MRRRPSARLLVLDGAGRILLFRFVHTMGVLAGQDYWTIPGGGVENGETFEQAAMRELEEETGIQIASVGPQIGQREFVLQLPDGEHVVADKRFFLIKASNTSLSRGGWTFEETQVMADHRWWSQDDLAQTSATVWPENILTMIRCLDP